MENTQILSQEQINLIAQRIIIQFSELKGAKFVGIKNYKSKGTGELSSHVVNANFDYGNAIKKDLLSLDALKGNDLAIISENINIPITIIFDAVNTLRIAFIKNQNKETASAQSLAQKNLFFPITNSIKLNLSNGKLHIYALAINKVIHEKGIYKVVKSRQLTIAKEAVKKYCKFSTAKYRSFIIDEKYLSTVNVSGETITVE